MRTACVLKIVGVFLYILRGACKDGLMLFRKILFAA